MSAARSWVEAVVAAGAAPARYVPDASLGRVDEAAVAGAELVEGVELEIHPLVDGFRPEAAAFLDGIQHWRVVAYDGVTPVVRALVAAAVRHRGRDRRLVTALEASRELAVTRLAGLSPAVRGALERAGVEILELAEADLGQPGRTLEAARRAVEGARVEAEREVGERYAAGLAPDEWLVVDGVLSESARLARHPRVLGVVKSHSAQYFEGPALARALRLPPRHRTSVFRPRGRARHEVYSWYLRLWPWEGNDLLYGLLRIETRAHPDAVEAASRVGGWLYAERAPLATPDARWDRLLYPIHDVETYLNARVPREFFPAAGSRLPASRL
ncbi:MAG TPA: hypothetical protein VNI61_08320 [Gemmatimonadales bacterium]|nr:hypothetical protein [Gemmatimonadales bacterium]